MNMRDYRFSRFVHFLSIENSVALYNSLNLTLIYVTPQLFSFINQDSLNTKELFSDEMTEPIKSLVDKLLKQRILVRIDENELEDYDYWQTILPTLPVGILYLLLTDSCNFSCKYCVIEGGIPQGFRRSLMSVTTAKKAIDLFARIIAVDEMCDDHALIVREPQIILYGGEPLINQEALKFIMEYARELKRKHVLPERLGITINTNASLITEEIANLLAEHQATVAVSLDGKQIQHDAARKYKSGRGTFDDVMNGFQLLKRAGANASISCTLGWHNLDDLDDILKWFVHELGISGFGFNILVDSETIKIPNIEEYADRVSNALIQCFRLCRELGVYEDRMMRKIQAFVEGRLYINDCAGCGQQIVVTPDGQIGPCQAYAGSRKYFIKLSDDLDVRNHPIWQEWRMRSPLNMPQCIDCIALGICGGGCPHNAYQRTGSIWNVDEVFCVHAKKTIHFLIEDLYNKMGDTKTNGQI